MTGDWFAELNINVTEADIATICERAAMVADRETDTPTVVTRPEFKASYNEFTEGRIDSVAMTEDMSPAFQ